jgi:hypothetical protein
MKDKEKIQKGFNVFNEGITLKPTKRDNLIRGRNGLRNKIKSEFTKKERIQPKFCMQGSFAMKTTTNPVDDGEYDVDDGVYLQGFGDKEISEWPNPQTVHNWVMDAVSGYTSIDPIDKNTCIRVTFVDGYHVDLPIYINKNESIYLADKKNGWSISDPKEFTDWFIDKVSTYGEQLRSTTKYLKAWKDFNNIDLKGLEVTILGSNSFYSNVNNDLNSLLGTISNINNRLENGFLCFKPVKPYENLFQKKSENQKSKILTSLKKLEEELNRVANETDIEKASEILVSLFGDRFPKLEKEKEKESTENYIRTDSPAILRNDGHSA